MSKKISMINIKITNLTFKKNRIINVTYFYLPFFLKKSLLEKPQNMFK